MIWLDLNKLCMGCMQQKTDQAAECSFCGFTEGTEPESPLHLRPRIILEGKYLIGRVLGQGGFGITYLAWDLNLNVKLAIKEYFPQELASRAAGHSQVSAYSGSMGSQYEYGLDKFLQEARTLAQFEGHPNIVSVRDFFKANGTAYFVMSYVEGITVKDYLASSGGVLPLDKAQGIIMPVLDALKEVHAANILHRDISPDNIFINQKGQVILIDFGAARQAVSEKGQSLSIILKPGYAPEEQYRSKGVQGPWTDIYAVGATFYHLIAGKQPPEALERMIEDALVPPRDMGVSISETEERALMKALSIRAADRYQTIEEFQAGLMGENLEGKVITPLPAPVKEVVKQDTTGKKKKQPLGVIFGAAALIIAAVSLFVLWSGGMLGEDTSTLHEEQQIEDEKEEIIIAEAEPEPEEIVDQDDAPEEVKDQGDEALKAAPEEKEDKEKEKEESETEESSKAEEDEKTAGEEQPESKTVTEEEETDSTDILTEDTISWDGGTYTGQLKDGEPHGEGKWSHPDGTKYEGEFYEGKIQGYGEMTFPGGEIYKGELRNGVAHGDGIMIHPDGRRVGRLWVNGELVED